MANRERPARWVVASVDAALRGRAFALRFFPRRRSPRLVTQERMRSYPYGYPLGVVGVAESVHAATQITKGDSDLEVADDVGKAGGALNPHHAPQRGDHPL